MSRQDYHYAVVVGIKDYPAIETLQHARSDAQDFASWLRDDDGGRLPPQNVREIVATDQEMQGKTRADGVPIAKQVWEALNAIREEMDRALAKDVKVFDRSRLYFFVSGHGIAPKPGDAALLMADSGPDIYNNVSCDSLIKFFEVRQSFKEVVVFADCCRQMPSGECDPGGPPWPRVRRGYGGVRKVWGFATDFDDVALEPLAVLPTVPADDRHGYFTRALLECLRGKAGEEIDAEVLTRYVKSRVQALTQGRQNPEIIPSDRVVFRAGRPRPERSVTIRFPVGYAGRVELTRSNLDICAVWDASQGPCIIALPDGYYRVQLEGNVQPNPFIAGGMFAVEGKDLDVQL